MDIICASICYRGFAADEVAMTLERAPAIGYRFMEVHGDATWTPPAVKVFDLPGVQARLKASGMRCAGVYSPCWGGHDEADVAERAEAIVSVVRIAEASAADHVTSTGASPRGEPGGLEPRDRLRPRRAGPHPGPHSCPAGARAAFRQCA